MAPKKIIRVGDRTGLAMEPLELRRKCLKIVGLLLLAPRQSVEPRGSAQAIEVVEASQSVPCDLSGSVGG